jgi:hypothetical protein
MPRFLERWERELARIDAESDAEHDRIVDEARDDWDRERGRLTDDDSED